LRHTLALALSLLALALVTTIAVSGCISNMQASPYAGATAGQRLYDAANASYWKYGVVMTAGGTNSTWNMTVNSSRDASGEGHMVIVTLGNGLNETYDVGWNTSTYQVDSMHAMGWIGDRYQERNVSPLQIQTLPDTGLIYYFVPFQYAGNVTVRDVNGRAAALGVFTAADTSGFRVTYWVHPSIPVPVKIEMSDKDFDITMMLIDYR